MYLSKIELVGIVALAFVIGGCSFFKFVAISDSDGRVFKCSIVQKNY